MSIDVKIGTAPDNWGVWFPNDPKQIPWNRFLDEIVEADYKWTELGPPGYLPQNPSLLADELKKRGLEVTTGFVMQHFEDPALWPVIESEVHSVGRVLQQLRAPFCSSLATPTPTFSPESQLALASSIQTVGSGTSKRSIAWRQWPASNTDFELFIIPTPRRT